MDTEGMRGGIALQTQWGDMTDDRNGPGRHLARRRRPRPHEGEHANQSPDTLAPAETHEGYDDGVQVRRFATLTFLSTIVPGLGLLWTKKRRVGLLLVALAVFSLLIIGILVLSGGALAGVAEVLTSNGLKTALLVITFGLFLWLTSIVLTARTTHTGGWSRGGEVVHKVFTALMCLIVTMPAAEAVRYVAVTQDAFGKMFINNGNGADGHNALKEKGRVNFLLLGSDAGTDRSGTRTDSMMVASVDTKTGDTTLISIPRNLQRVPFPESNPLHKLYPNGFYCTSGSNPCIMDAVWATAEVEHRDMFPKDAQYVGLNTTRDVIGEITGLHIDYTTVIDLQGFRDLVDAMGGVNVNIPAGGIAIGGRIVGGQIVPGSITGRIPEGPQHLDGQHALWYARSRVETGDNDRMRRQRCMVNALLDQSNPVSLVEKFPNIMRVAKENILVDMPQNQLPDLADLANSMKNGQMKSVNLAYPIISDADPDFTKIRALVQQGFKRPKAAPKKKAAATSSSTSPTTPTSSTSTTEAAVSDTAASC